MSRPSVCLETSSEEETEAVGRRLGELLPAHTVVALVGALGAGKTAFARGVAAGLGIDPAEVSSPTFVYLVEYGEGRVPLVHADLYRLLDVPEEAAGQAFESIGLVDAIDGDGVSGPVVIVEWWDCYRGPDPQRLVRVEIVARSGDVRSIHLEFRGDGLTTARQGIEP